MTRLLFLFFSALPFGAFAQTIQLAPPQTSANTWQSPFFTDSLTLGLRFALPGSAIRYTLDGTLPGKQAPVFKGNVSIHKTCLLTAVAEHPDFATSDPTYVQFVQVPRKFQPAEATLATTPSAQYPGNGAATLHDYGKGHEDMHSGQWLGFEGHDMDYSMVFSHKIKARSLMVSIFSAPSSWVLPPRRIELWVAKGKKGTFQSVASMDIPAVQEGEKGPAERFYFLKFRKKKGNHWRVVVTNGGPLPAWHPGKGSPAWLFVDEVQFVR